MFQNIPFFCCRKATAITALVKQIPKRPAQCPICELSSRQGTGRAANDGRRCCTTKLSRNAFREFPGTEFGKHASGKTTSKAVTSGSGEGAAD
ncbi:hypothetical protein, partial [Thiolapillus sp.]|uniref:hypothetical protein n=1 Tax=Thiolapillus sp. TaxID=2017437 RepID=UPI003AF8F8A8